jgi:uncharacterized protein
MMGMMKVDIQITTLMMTITRPDIVPIIQATRKCNKKCTYCFLGDAEPEDMSLETTDNIIRKFINYNSFGVRFIWEGGEPLLRPVSYFSFIKKVSDKYNTASNKNLKIAHSLQTNGLLLIDETRIKLQEMGFGIAVSYDGDDELQHERKNIYEENTGLVKANILSANKTTGLISVITRKSIGKEEKIYKNLKKLVNNASLSFYFSNGQDKAKIKELRPTPAEAKELHLNFYKLWRDDKESFHLRPYVDIVKSFLKGVSSRCNYSAISCYKIVGIAPNGDVFNCARAVNIPEMKLGNINEDNLEDILSAKPRDMILDRYIKLRKENRKYFHLDSGGCPIEAYHRGDIMQPEYYSKSGVREHLFNLIERDLNDKSTFLKLVSKIY